MDKCLDIIELLYENSRLTDEQIAAMTGLDLSEVKDIIKNWKMTRCF